MTIKRAVYSEFKNKFDQNVILRVIYRVLTKGDKDNLNAFQRFAGRRVQRLSYRSPNASSFYGLGWFRLVTYINVKKLLFVLTIVKLKTTSFFRNIFKKRLTFYLENPEMGIQNPYMSPFFDIFTVCDKYGLLHTVTGMINGDTVPYGKDAWSKLCWERAWESEDVYWKTTSVFHKDNNLINLIIPDSRYINWWHLADLNQGLMRICENMVKIICRASKLKCDDTSLKGALPSLKRCELCDHYAPEDIFHILMQCTHFEDKRRELYELIYLIHPDVQETFENEPQSVFSWLIGKSIEGLDYEVMLNVWRVSGGMINDMYTQVVQMRKGIG